MGVAIVILDDISVLSEDGSPAALVVVGAAVPAHFRARGTVSVEFVAIRDQYLGTAPRCCEGYLCRKKYFNKHLSKI